MAGTFAESASNARTRSLLPARAEATMLKKSDICSDIDECIAGAEVSLEERNFLSFVFAACHREADQIGLI
jgi:hypothetical protein